MDPSPQSGAARADRDRRIIQETAALLSADFPLAQLIERLCDSLAAALGATVSFVALPGSDRIVRLAYFNDHGQKRRPSDFALPKGSQTHNVFITGRSILKRQLADWKSEERFALNADRPETDDSVSAVWVPIKYSDEVLGVLSVQSPQPEHFDSDDVKLLEAVARYLAIAVRNQRSLRVAAHPWAGTLQPIIAIGLIALLATIVFIGFYYVRAAQMRSVAESVQLARADHVADGLEAYLLNADQLARSTAALVSPVRADKAQVERVLSAMLASAPSPQIYGIGAWFAPYEFVADTKYFGPYEHRERSAPQRLVLTYEWTRPSYNYPAQPWYQAGLHASGVIYTEPYFDTDYVYISAVKSFYGRAGKIAGVVSVDMIVATLRQFIAAQNDPPRSVIYVLTNRGRLFLYPQQVALLASARGAGLHPKSILDVPRSFLQRQIAQNYGANRSEIEAPVAYTNWKVVVSTDQSLLNGGVRALRYVVALAIFVLWIATGMIVVTTLRTRSHRMRTLDLELAQVELHSEIATRIEAEERLRERAYHDSLTGLPNRAFILKQLESVIARASADPGFRFAVLFVDLDRFNVVNDSLGHAMGDRLLAALGRRLESRVHSNDIVARIGGDEFVVLIQNLQSEDDATAIAGRLTGAMIEPFQVDEQEIFMSASVGIALSQPDYTTPEEILRDADIAMYHAKKMGRAGHQVFDREMHNRAVQQMQLETDLRRALVRDELFLEYQPIFTLRDNRVVGFEALVRWNHPSRGTIYPDAFIPLAEQTRLILPLSSFVLAEAAKQVSRWIAENRHLYVLVNVSAIRFTKPGFLEEIAAVLSGAGIPPSAIRLEITESAIMENAEAAENVLGELRSFGIRSQIDDFGTGYSSLSYLQRLPIDGLKIDRSFVGAMTSSAAAAEIVRAIVSLARSLNLQVIAEGIETMEQAQQLEALGIDYGQGFYLARPGSAAAAQPLLEKALAVD